MAQRLSHFLASRFSGLTAAILVWATIVTAGTASLVRYSTTPGPSTANASAWPAGDSISITAGRANLIMAIHPDCPCSRASLNELETLIATCHGKVSATVLFVDYPGTTTNIKTSELWLWAARIADVIPVDDVDGQLANRFNAKTSGQVLLYDTDQTLRFSGGITDSRGHAGDNDGLSAIVAILNQKTPTTTQTPVYGCGL